MKGNSYSREVKTKEETASTSGQIKEDKFDALWSDKTKTPATVAMGVQESMEYGALKVSATVSLHCDQNEATIDKAGELAFFKALELMRDGWREMTKG